MPTGKAIVALLLTVLVIGAYLAGAMLLGIREYWAGFLFLFQWGMMEELKMERLPRSAVGSAVGLAAAFLPVWLAPAIGAVPAGLALLAASLVLTFLLIKQALPLVVNGAAILFLTVATIPHISQETPPGAAFLGLAAGILFFGGLAGIVAAIGRSRRAPEADGAAAAPAE